jgi:hypothetical protein
MEHRENIRRKDLYPVWWKEEKIDLLGEWVDDASEHFFITHIELGRFIRVVPTTRKQERGLEVRVKGRPGEISDVRRAVGRRHYDAEARWDDTSVNLKGDILEYWTRPSGVDLLVHINDMRANQRRPWVPIIPTTKAQEAGVKVRVSLDDVSPWKKG